MTTEKRAYKARNGRSNGTTVESFRIYVDEELAPWLRAQGGHSRYINGLIRRDMEERIARGDVPLHVARDLGLQGYPSALGPDSGALVPPAPDDAE